MEERLAREAGRPIPWLLAFAVLLAVQIDGYWWPTRDASQHFSIARSFASGAGPALFGAPQLFYPPGYGLVISPAFLVSAKPFLALSLLHYVFALAVLAAVFVWARRLERDLALWATGLVVLNVSFWNYTRPTLTEAAFMASSLWAALLLHRAALTRSPPAALGGVLLLMLASSMRYPGILFGCGFGLAQLLRCRRGEIRLFAAIGSTLLVVLPAALMIVFLLWRESATAQLNPGSGGGYLLVVLELFREASHNLVESFRLRLWEIGRLLVPGMFKAYAPERTWLHPTLFVYLPVVAIVARGWWLLVRSRSDVLLLTLPLHVGLFMTWLGDQGTRYMLPMLPALGLSLLVGIRRFNLPWRHSVMALLVVVHGAVALGYYVKELPEARALHGRWPEVESVARVLADQGTANVEVALPRSLRLMLRIELDRRFSEPADRPASGALWLITREGVEPPTGFHAHSPHGTLRLHRRPGNP